MSQNRGVFAALCVCTCIRTYVRTYVCVCRTSPCPACVNSLFFFSSAWYTHRVSYTELASCTTSQPVCVPHTDGSDAPVFEPLFSSDEVTFTVTERAAKGWYFIYSHRRFNYLTIETSRHGDRRGTGAGSLARDGAVRSGRGRGVGGIVCCGHQLRRDQCGTKWFRYPRHCEQIMAANCVELSDMHSCT